MLLTNGRSRVYHTPQDVPAELAWDKMAATARWLERFTRQQCARERRPFSFANRRDDLTTLESMKKLLTALAPVQPQAEVGLQMVKELRSAVQADRSLPASRAPELMMLIAGLEQGLA